jgi:hypothetical protein
MPISVFDYIGIVESLTSTDGGGSSSSLQLKVDKISPLSEDAAAADPPFSSMTIEVNNTGSYLKTLSDALIPGDSVLFCRGKILPDCGVIKLTPENYQHDSPLFVARIEENDSQLSIDFLKSCFDESFYPSFDHKKICTIAEFFSSFFSGACEQQQLYHHGSEYFKWKVLQAKNPCYSFNIKFVRNLNYLCYLFLRHKLTEENIDMFFVDNGPRRSTSDKRPCKVIDFIFKRGTRFRTAAAAKKKFGILTVVQIEKILVQWFRKKILRCFNLLGITNHEFKSILTTELFLTGAAAPPTKASCKFCKLDAENEKNELKNLIDYQLLDWCGLCGKETTPAASSLTLPAPLYYIVSCRTTEFLSSSSVLPPNHNFEYIIKCILRNPFAFYHSLSPDKVTSIFFSSHCKNSPAFPVLLKSYNLMRKLSSHDLKTAGLEITPTDDTVVCPLKTFVETNKSILTRVFGMVQVAKSFFDYSRYRIDTILSLFVQQSAKEMVPSIEKCSTFTFRGGEGISVEQKNVISHCLGLFAGGSGATGISITIITGGPGVGKSTILKNILENTPAAKLPLLRIASFTGKAVARVKEVTGCRNGAMIATIDRIITKKDFDFDFLIIDEASMMSAELLFNVIMHREAYLRQKPLSRICSDILNGRGGASSFSPLVLVLIGDKDQLPPIQWGDIFTDWVTGGTDNRYPGVKVYSLTENFRSDRELYNFFNYVNYSCGGDLATAESKVNLRSGVAKSKWPEIVLDEINKISGEFSFDKTRFLEHVGIACVYNAHVGMLNNILRAYYFSMWKGDATDGSCGAVPPGSKFNIGDRIMMTQNVHLREEDADDGLSSAALSNGDMGYIRKFVAPSTFVVEFDLHPGIEITFSSTGGATTTTDDTQQPLPLEYLVFGYSLTVHKMQGSEYDHIIFFLPQRSSSSLPPGGGGDFFTRSLIYTAVTRAKKSITIICEGDVQSTIESYS